jgi:hypothetical protein
MEYTDKNVSDWCIGALPTDQLALETLAKKLMWPAPAVGDKFYKQYELDGKHTAQILAVHEISHGQWRASVFDADMQAHAISMSPGTLRNDPAWIPAGAILNKLLVLWQPVGYKVDVAKACFVKSAPAASK